MSKKSADMVFANVELAKAYSQYRPSPPESLIKRILDLTTDKKLCLDVGCGSGQNTELFADHFEKVIGLDVSSDQLQIAIDRNTFTNVEYKEGSSFSLPVEERSVDLVSACAAVHWFDLEDFYEEVDRVLKPGGVLACYSYHGCTPIYNGNSLRKEFLEIWDELNDYWSIGHNLLRNEYADLPPCYSEDVKLRGFSVESNTSLEAVIGYIISWSAFTKKKQIEGEEAAAKFVQHCKDKLLTSMGTKDANPPMVRRYDYFLRLWRKPVS